MKNAIKIVRPLPNGETKEDFIGEIPEEEIDQYLLLGTAVGESIGHCIYEGTLHSENFLNRVMGYRIIENDFGIKIDKVLIKAGLDKPKKMSVSFYGKELS